MDCGQLSHCRLELLWNNGGDGKCPAEDVAWLPKPCLTCFLKQVASLSSRDVQAWIEGALGVLSDSCPADDLGDSNGVAWVERYLSLEKREVPQMSYGPQLLEVLIASYTYYTRCDVGEASSASYSGLRDLVQLLVSLWALLPISESFSGVETFSACRLDGATLLGELSSPELHLSSSEGEGGAIGAVASRLLQALEQIVAAPEAAVTRCSTAVQLFTHLVLTTPDLLRAMAAAPLMGRLMQLLQAVLALHNAPAAAALLRLFHELCLACRASPSRWERVAALLLATAESNHGALSLLCDVVEWAALHEAVLLTTLALIHLFISHETTRLPFLSSFPASDVGMVQRCDVREESTRYLLQRLIPLLLHRSEAVICSAADVLISAVQCSVCEVFDAELGEWMEDYALESLRRPSEGIALPLLRLLEVVHHASMTASSRNMETSSEQQQPLDGERKWRALFHLAEANMEIFEVAVRTAYFSHVIHCSRSSLDEIAALVLLTAQQHSAALSLHCFLRQLHCLALASTGSSSLLKSRIDALAAELVRRLQQNSTPALLQGEEMMEGHWHLLQLLPMTTYQLLLRVVALYLPQTELCSSIALQVLKDFQDHFGDARSPLLAAGHHGITIRNVWCGEGPLVEDCISILSISAAMVWWWRRSTTGGIPRKEAAVEVETALPALVQDHLFRRLLGLLPSVPEVAPYRVKFIASIAGVDMDSPPPIPHHGILTVEELLHIDFGVRPLLLLGLAALRCPLEGCQVLVAELLWRCYESFLEENCRATSASLEDLGGTEDWCHGDGITREGDGDTSIPPPLLLRLDSLRQYLEGQWRLSAASWLWHGNLPVMAGASPVPSAAHIQDLIRWVGQLTGLRRHLCEVMDELSIRNGLSIPSLLQCMYGHPVLCGVAAASTLALILRPASTESQDTDSCDFNYLDTVPWLECMSTSPDNSSALTSLVLDTTRRALLTALFDRLCRVSAPGSSSARESLLILNSMQKELRDGIKRGGGLVPPSPVASELLRCHIVGLVLWTGTHPAIGDRLVSHILRLVVVALLPLKPTECSECDGVVIRWVMHMILASHSSVALPSPLPLLQVLSLLLERSHSSEIRARYGGDLIHFIRRSSQYTCKDDAEAVSIRVFSGFLITEIEQKCLCVKRRSVKTLWWDMIPTEELQCSSNSQDDAQRRLILLAGAYRVLRCYCCGPFEAESCTRVELEVIWMLLEVSLAALLPSCDAVSQRLFVAKQIYLLLHRYRRWVSVAPVIYAIYCWCCHTAEGPATSTPLERGWILGGLIYIAPYAPWWRNGYHALYHQLHHYLTTVDLTCFGSGAVARDTTDSSLAPHTPLSSSAMSFHFNSVLIHACQHFDRYGGFEALPVHRLVDYSKHLAAMESTVARFVFFSSERDVLYFFSTTVDEQTPWYRCRLLT